MNMTETETGSETETGATDPRDRDRLQLTLRSAQPEGVTESRPATVETKASETKPPQTPGAVWRWRDRRAQQKTVQQVQTAETRAAALAAAGRSEHTSPERVETETEIAPIPQPMKWAAVWLDRTFGAVPLAAPLVVSGMYTMQVFTDHPLNAHPLVALAATCALEGGVWKLSRLYEKTLVAGDSTIALRLGIGLYLAIISGLIYWHAFVQAKLAGKEELGYDAMPAFGVAIMSALGVYIWSRTARWQRRRELHALGRVDRQAPKFAALAWILTPVETAKALRHAVKYRIESPVVAVSDRRLFVAAGKPAIWPPIGRTETGTAVKTTPKPPASRVETPRRETASAPVETAAAPNGDRPTQTVGTGQTVKPKTGRPGLHVAGKPSDEAYVRMVRDRYTDWADPGRRQPVSAGEVMAATGLRGKETARRIQRALYADPTEAKEAETVARPFASATA